MVSWHSAEEIAKDSVAFTNLLHALLGLYVWEFVTSLSFEWAFISGKKTFRWPLIFYFGGRYCLLFALIGVAVALNVTVEIDCQALYIFNEVMGNASIGLASINLSIRTMAVWSQKYYIMGPLILIIIGHWVLLMQGILLRAKWVPGEGCVITETRSRLLAITFLYSMLLDFIVMCLTAWKLLYMTSGRSRLMNLIFKDGLIYFVIAFLANALATVFMMLNLNPIMSIIFNVPAAIASTVVASRAVRRLMKFASFQEVFTVTGQGTNIAFRPTTAPKMPPVMRVKRPDADGVHVKMDTFTVTEAVPSPSSYLSDYTYDAVGRPFRKKAQDLALYDVESQLFELSQSENERDAEVFGSEETKRPEI